MKNSQEMRVFLLDKMVGVADGSIAVDQARAICNLSQQVYNTLNVEIKTAHARVKLGDTPIAPVEFNSPVALKADD